MRRILLSQLKFEGSYYKRATLNRRDGARLDIYRLDPEGTLFNVHFYKDRVYRVDWLDECALLAQAIIFEFCVETTRADCYLPAPAPRRSGKPT